MDVVVWGGTGQAKVVRAILTEAGHRVCLVYDRDPSTRAPFDSIEFVHDVSRIRAAAKTGEVQGFVVAIGGVNGRDRLQVAELLDSFGLDAISVVHTRAWIDATADLGAGCQVLALAGVGVDTRLGRQCILNTAATVDHECVVGDGVHIMPGATIAGCVTIGDGASVGSNATVLPRLSIGADAVVGAGAVVTHDVPAGVVVVGVPARIRTRPADESSEVLTR